MEAAQTERLIALLHAQRREAAMRSGLARNTTAWTDSSARLDALNDQIMHTGASGAVVREPGLVVREPVATTGANTAGTDRDGRTA